MELWMRIGQPLEPVIDDYPRIFDAWEAGGVRGLVFGRLLFADASGGFTLPAIPARPQAYRDRGMQPGPARSAPPADRERGLHRLLDDAKRRGWELLVFCPGQGTALGGGLPLAADPYGAHYTAAVWEEVFTALPQADGGIMDGWTEAPYELVYHHGNAVFAELPPAARERAEVRGWNAARLESGRAQVAAQFRQLTPSRVRCAAGRGLLAGLALFDLDEDGLYWLRWRRLDSLREGQAVRRELDRLPRRVTLGNGLRSAAFSGMTAVDFAAWDQIADYLLVKHYFWHRGFDGLYGTVARWVRQIGVWNPSLSEADCFTVVRAWLGIDLPEVRSLADMELGFPQAFFDQVVHEETARALAAVSDPRKVVPWVDTGRMPHGGDPMTSGDLHRILDASARAGLQRFLFHNHGHLTTAEWSVICRWCGQPWVEDPAGYWPPATPKPETY
jgi:hypothetical protein